MRRTWSKTHHLSLKPLDRAGLTTPATQPRKEDPSVLINENRQVHAPRKLFVNILLASWFSLLTSFASISVLVTVSTLCYPLNLKGTYYLVDGHKEQVLWLVILLFMGLLVWFIADITRGKRLLSGESDSINFLYVSLLAGRIVSVVFGVSIPIVLLSWLINFVLPEKLAVPLSSLVVLLLLYYIGHGSRAKRRDRRPN